MSVVGCSNNEVFNHFEKCGFIMSPKLKEFIVADIEVYSAICKLFADGKDIDITLLVNEIGKGNLSKVEGITYITELITSGLPIKPKEYIKILKDKSYRRKAIKELSTAIQCMYYENSKPVDAISKMSENLANDMKNKNTIFSDSDLMVKTLMESN